RAATASAACPTGVSRWLAVAIVGVTVAGWRPMELMRATIVPRLKDTSRSTRMIRSSATVSGMTTSATAKSVTQATKGIDPPLVELGDGVEAGGVAECPGGHLLDDLVGFGEELRDLIELPGDRHHVVEDAPGVRLDVEDGGERPVDEDVHRRDHDDEQEQVPHPPRLHASAPPFAEQLLEEPGDPALEGDPAELEPADRVLRPHRCRCRAPLAAGQVGLDAAGELVHQRAGDVLDHA